MSSIDRLTNLARGVLSGGQKRLEAGGGLAGVARRAGEQAREVAESARGVVREGLSGLTEPAAAASEDPALAAARSEVDELRASSVSRRPSPRSAPVSAADTPDALSRELEALDARLRTGAIDKATWESERTLLLDARDRASASRSPRRRTL